MVLTANGKVAETMDVRDRIAKKGSGRRIPIHKDLRSELALLLRRGICDGPIMALQGLRLPKIGPELQPV
jgi:integrase/recombinase XerD